MIITETIDTALEALFRSKLRSFLTILGIVIGVFSVILLVSIGSGMKSYVSKQFESLGATTLFVIPGDMEASGGDPAGFKMVLTMKHVRDIKRIGYPVRQVSAGFETYSKASYKDKEESIHIMGTDLEGINILNFEIETGISFTQTDLDTNDKVVVLGSKIAEKLYGTLNPINKTFLIQNTRYRVIGIFKTKGGSGPGQSFDDIVFLPITTAMKHFNQDKLASIYIQAASKEEIENTKRATEKVLAKSLKDDEFTVMGSEDLLKTINQVLSMMQAGLGGIAAISLVVGGIGIMNIMFVTVTERTREIGLRKALGATPQDILTQFLIESVTVSCVGGIIGIILAMGGSIIINQFFTSEITPTSIALAFGFSSLIGVIFGVIPAWKAAKLDPIQALRYE